MFYKVPNIEDYEIKIEEEGKYFRPVAIHKIKRTRLKGNLYCAKELAQSEINVWTGDFPVLKPLYFTYS